MKSCSYPGRSRNLGLGFEYNSLILRVLRFWEKGQDGEKQQNTLKKTGPQSKDLNVRAKTDFLLLTEKKKEEKERWGERANKNNLYFPHIVRYISEFSLQTSQTPRTICYFSCQRIQAKRERQPHSWADSKARVHSRNIFSWTVYGLIIKTFSSWREISQWEIHVNKY